MACETASKDGDGRGRGTAAAAAGEWAAGEQRSDATAAKQDRLALVWALIYHGKAVWLICQALCDSSVIPAPSVG